TNGTDKVKGEPTGTSTEDGVMSSRIWGAPARLESVLAETPNARASAIDTNWATGPLPGTPPTAQPQPVRWASGRCDRSNTMGLLTKGDVPTGWSTFRSKIFPLTSEAGTVTQSSGSVSGHFWSVSIGFLRMKTLGWELQSPPSTNW